MSRDSVTVEPLGLSRTYLDRGFDISGGRELQ